MFDLASMIEVCWVETDQNLEAKQEESQAVLKSGPSAPSLTSPWSMSGRQETQLEDRRQRYSLDFQLERRNEETYEESEEESEEEKSNYRENTLDLEGITIDQEQEFYLNPSNDSWDDLLVNVKVIKASLTAFFSN